MNALIVLAKVLNKLRYLLTLAQIIVMLAASTNIALALVSGITALASIKGFYWFMLAMAAMNRNRIDG